MRPFVDLRTLEVMLLALALASCSRTSLDSLVVDEDGPDQDTDASGGMTSDAEGDVDRAEDATADVPVKDLCSRPGATLIYAISGNSPFDNALNTLYSFDPASSTFTKIGGLRCHDADGVPHSMAVDREGTAYVDFAITGTLYRVDTRTAECAATSFAPQGAGFGTFEAAFVTDVASGAETLFASGDTDNAPHWLFTLGTIDLHTLVWNPSGKYTPLGGSGSTQFVSALAGTDTGDLYALAGSATEDTTDIVRLDPKTAEVLDVEAVTLPKHLQVETITRALAFWGGDFYMFVLTSPPGASDMATVPVRYHPGGTTTRVDAKLDDEIAVAASSPCASQD
jgi:hypothetical protein